MSPYDLLNTLAQSKIEYAYWDYKHDKPVKPDDPDWQNPELFEDLCRVLRPEEVYEKKIGTCWDLTLLAFAELTKMRYAPGVVYFERTLANKEFQSHTFVYFEETKAKSWYWFEYSWYPHRGIHGPFFSKKALLDIVKRIAGYDSSKVTMWKDVKPSTFRKLLEIDIITPDVFLKHTRDA